MKDASKEFSLRHKVDFWESNPARVKASGRGAKCYPRGEYTVQILEIFGTVYDQP
jgi:hypothetical protein